MHKLKELTNKVKTRVTKKGMEQGLPNPVPQPVEHWSKIGLRVIGGIAIISVLLFAWIAFAQGATALVVLQILVSIIAPFLKLML